MAKLYYPNLGSPLEEGLPRKKEGITLEKRESLLFKGFSSKKREIHEKFKKKIYSLRENPSVKKESLILRVNPTSKSELLNRGNLK